MEHTKKQKTNYTKRLEYLLVNLEYVEKRRNAVEGKSSILMAACAIVLTAMSNFGFLDALSASTFPQNVRAIFTMLTLSCLVFSILCCSRVLSGHMNDKSRGRIMDIEGEYNIFHSGKIAELKKDVYLAEVENLTDRQVFEQLGAEVHNVSRIARDRYKYFNWANRLFVLSVIALMVLVIIEWLS